MASPMQKVMSMTIQGCILSFISNIIAQSITAYRSDIPFSINWQTIYQFLLWTIISTPPNYLFQSYIEHLLPSQTVVPSSYGVDVASHAKSPTPDLPEKSSAPLVKSKLNITNTLIKFAIDQTLMATLNTLGFSAGMATIRGANTQVAWQKAKEEYWPVMRAGWKLWPWVSLANFSLVKTVEMRQLVGGLAGLVWGVYLSILYSH